MNAFKAMRRKVGLSQRDVASKLGYSTPQFISNWERGVSYPPLGGIKKLAQLYKVVPIEIVGQIKESEIKELEKKYSKFI